MRNSASRSRVPAGTGPAGTGRARTSSAFAAACSTEENGNPAVLWLDLDGSEIRVRLVEQEPVPF